MGQELSDNQTINIRFSLKQNTEMEAGRLQRKLRVARILTIYSLGGVDAGFLGAKMVTDVASDTAGKEGGDTSCNILCSQAPIYSDFMVSCITKARIHPMGFHLLTDVSNDVPC